VKLVTFCCHSGHLDGTPGGAGLILALSTGKRHWRSPDVRRQPEG
jgi:hypothetical protein